MLHIASCSFGKDSLAMVLILIEKHYPLDEVIFYNTGVEFEAIYHIRDKLIPILQEHGIGYTELQPDRPFLYDMLEKPVYSKKNGKHNGYGWCGGACRWGTQSKKTVIDRYIKSLNEEVYEYIGIASDEINRVKEKHYPLVEWGMTEKDCLSYCREHGWQWTERENGKDFDLYDILERVSCWCCANKNQKELYSIYRFLPSYWERLRNLQMQIEKPMKRYYRNKKPCGNVFQLEQRFKEQEKSRWQLIEQARNGEN